MSTIKLKLENLSCPSCAVDVDLTLEDLEGVKQSTTIYATSQTTISFDSTMITINQIQSKLETLGYKTTLLK